MRKVFSNELPAQLDGRRKPISEVSSNDSFDCRPAEVPIRSLAALAGNFYLWLGGIPRSYFMLNPKFKQAYAIAKAIPNCATLEMRRKCILAWCWSAKKAING